MAEEDDTPTTEDETMPATPTHTLKVRTWAFRADPPRWIEAGTPVVFVRSGEGAAAKNAQVTTVDGEAVMVVKKSNLDEVPNG